MTDRTFPWYAWNPADFLNDEDVISMTKMQELAYRRLLDRAWISPNCGLPDDDEKLAKMIQFTPEEWLDCRLSVISKFTKRKNRLFNKKLLRLRRQAEEISRKKKAAATSRWQKDRSHSGVLDVKDTRNANRMLKQHRTKQQNSTLQDSSGSSESSKGLDLMESTSTSQSCLSKTIERDEDDPDGGMRHKPNARVLLNREFQGGEYVSGAGRRHREFPWHSACFMERMRGKESSERRQKYFEMHNRTPEEPARGWVNRNGKWEQFAV
jgi:uncharacterized protein YdaU (DUF1376 family)